MTAGELITKLMQVDADAQVIVSVGNPAVCADFEIHEVFTGDVGDAAILVFAEGQYDFTPPEG